MPEGGNHKSVETSIELFRLTFFNLLFSIESKIDIFF
jgi:hypothetical protein